MKKFAFVLLCWLGWLGCSSPQLLTTRVPQGDLPAFLTYPNPKVPAVSAHRGGGYPGYPENCLASFAFILRQTPALIECDVRMSADSVLLLMHDRSLDRTTTGSGVVAELLWADMQPFYLVDSKGNPTPYRIPSLDQTLRWARRQRAILTLDVKRDVPFDRVVAAIQRHRAQGYAAVITYNLEDARTVHRLDPSLALSVSMRNLEEAQAALQSGIPARNMVAFTGTRLSPPALFQRLHQEGILCILGTLGNLDRRAMARGDDPYRKWQQQGVDIMATDRPVEAAQALRP